MVSQVLKEKSFQSTESLTGPNVAKAQGVSDERQCKEPATRLASWKPVGSINKNSFSGNRNPFSIPENGVKIPSIEVGSKY